MSLSEYAGSRLNAGPPLPTDSLDLDRKSSESFHHHHYHNSSSNSNSNHNQKHKANDSSNSSNAASPQASLYQQSEGQAAEKGREIKAGRVGDGRMCME